MTLVAANDVQNSVKYWTNSTYYVEDRIQEIFSPLYTIPSSIFEGGHIVKHTIISAISLLAASIISYYAATASTDHFRDNVTNMAPYNEIVEHGGGCRKSSPPGQCCHMDNSTGRVHCH